MFISAIETTVINYVNYKDVKINMRIDNITAVANRATISPTAAFDIDGWLDKNNFKYIATRIALHTVNFSSGDGDRFVAFLQLRVSELVLFIFERLK